MLLRCAWLPAVCLSVTGTLVTGAMLSVAILSFASTGCKTRSYNNEREPKAQGEAVTSSWNPHDLLGLKSGNFNISLNAVLSERCRVLLKNNMQAKLSCLSSVNSFLNALNFYSGTVVDKETKAKAPAKVEIGILVSFQSEIDAMATDPKALEWVVAMTAGLQGVVQSDSQTFNLWDASLLHFDLDAHKALRHIAVLLQDAEAKSQIEYLAQTIDRTKHDLTFCTKLEALIDTLAAGIKTGRVILYPVKEAQAKASHYHFYVPAYIAWKMQKNAPGDRGSFYLPFVFNAEYELQLLRKSQDTRREAIIKQQFGSEKVGGIFNSIVRTQREFVNHVESFNAEANVSALSDIYHGYLGAMFGLQNKQTPIPFSEFSARMSENPMEFMKEFVLSY